MTEHSWKFPKPSRIMEIIEEWRHLDFKQSSHEDVDEKLKELIDSFKVILVSGYRSTPQKLWRIRPCNNLKTNISEFWEPPKRKTPLGRCNIEEEPVLYVSENSVTPFEEIKIKPFDTFYLIQYSAREECYFANIVPESLEPREVDTPGSPPLYEGDELVSYQILRDFIRTEFLKPVGEGTQFLHRISSSICRTWFGDDKYDGWRYPSVHLLNNKNIAIKPEKAHKKLEITKIEIVVMIPHELIPNSCTDESHPLVKMYKSAYNVRCLYEGEISGNTVEWTFKEAHSSFLC
ncbi:hypothetical protein [Altericista sp. CCNU0014]|uniref:hypothetical protein n=1 Tax=Altericista sp. CCNU0014 TaxID=3082949 RepID=UPI00384FB0DF